MLKVVSKSVILALLLTLLGSQITRAEVKHYRYDGKLPFVQMMLNMMVAMGILDRIPVNGSYGSYGYPGSSWSNYSNPYARALALRGVSPGSSSSYFQNPYLRNFNSGYGNNPFLRSPWLQSPWSQSGINSESPVWGTPSWGVLPVENYSSYNSPWESQVWSSSDLTGWVNEPWETSTWNPKAEKSTQSSPANSPLVQIYNSTNETQQPIQTQQPDQSRPPYQTQRPDQTPRPTQKQQHRPYNPSPLSKLVHPGYPNEQSRARSFVEPSTRLPERPTNKRPNIRVKEKPCITEFCGLKKPNLNGLWVAQNGEMLGINNHRFLWNDGDARYLTGQIKIQNEYLLASIDDHDRLMRFKYKLAGNFLLTLQPDGKIREFVRIPINQYLNQYQNYDQNYGNY